MKKRILLLALLCLILTGCTAPETEAAVTEAVPADYGLVVTLAQEEFRQVFLDFENLEITETATMVRSGDENHVVVQITYASDIGNGVYGFEFEKDNTGNIALIQQGEDVTIENLVG